jgi:hypothetical protein
MTTEEMKLDALLHVASQRLMRAGESVLQLRVAIQHKDPASVVAAASDFGEHLEIAEATFVEVARLLNTDKAAKMALSQIAARQQGGLIH